jgi:hypothetical protein
MLTGIAPKSVACEIESRLFNYPHVPEIIQCEKLVGIDIIMHANTCCLGVNKLYQKPWCSDFDNLFCCLLDALNL